jgi:hypothetical protein
MRSPAHDGFGTESLAFIQQIASAIIAAIAPQEMAAANYQL